MALKEGIKVAFEYHANTLTDTNESAFKLLKSINHSNMYSYWQPPVNLDAEQRLEGLNKILPWLSNIHAYYWESGSKKPLEDGINEWSKYMQVINNLEGDRYCMLEFVKDDTPEQFLKDAKVLKTIVSR